MLFVRNEWWEKGWHHPELIIRGRAVTSLGANPWLNSDDVLAFAWLYFFLSFSFVGLGCLSSGTSVCQTNFFLCQELPSFIPFWKILVLFLVLFYLSHLVKKTQTNKNPQPPGFRYGKKCVPCLWSIMAFLWCFLCKDSLFFLLLCHPHLIHTHHLQQTWIGAQYYLCIEWGGR